jgi:hypothetical protein
MSLRVMATLTLAALLLLPVSAVWAGGETTLRITISPISGDPGVSIAVTGLGAQAGIPVKVMLVTNGDTGEGSIADVSVNPAADGTFSATLVVPEGTKDGSYAVRAEQRNKNGGLIHFWWVGFNVGGGGALLPVTGTLPGTSIAFTTVLAALLVAALTFQGVRRLLRR